MSLLAACSSAIPAPTAQQRLLVQRDDQSIWLVGLDDGYRQQLTNVLTPADVVEWSLSPDQHWLVLIQAIGWRVTSHPDRGKAMLLNLATGQIQTLLNVMLPENYNWQAPPWDMDRAIIESKPLWSSDSQRFAIVSAHTGKVNLYLYTLATHQLQLVAQGHQNIAWPQWSPDEHYLLYNEIEGFGTGAGPTGGALWAVRVDGAEPPRRLSQDDLAFEPIDKWVDATHILTHKQSFARGFWDPRMIDIRTGKSTLAPRSTPDLPPPCWHYAKETNQLIFDLQWSPTINCNAALSPQGNFAYAINPGGIDQDGEFDLIDLHTGQKHLLGTFSIHRAGVVDPFWSPDGQYLLWLASDDHEQYTLWATQPKQAQPFRVLYPVKLNEKWIWLH